MLEAGSREATGNDIPEKGIFHGKITIHLFETPDGTQPFIEIEPMEFMNKLPELKQAKYFNMIASWAFQAFKEFGIPQMQPKIIVSEETTKH